MPMTDLSMPPRNLRPDDPVGGADAASADWPGPPYADYVLARLSLPEDCTLEGVNGKTVAGQLVAFDPAAGTIQVRLGSGRTVVPVTPDQVQQLTLNRLLAPDTADRDDFALSQLERPTPIEYRLRLADGRERQGFTLGHVETGEGLFLFPPSGDQGAVRRVFVPRAQYRSVGFGQRIGEILVDQHKLTV